MKRAAAAALLLMGLGACARRTTRVHEPLILPGNPCRLLLGFDDWQYPPSDRVAATLTGSETLPDDERRCLMSGVNLEVTALPALAADLERRLLDWGWLEARVQVVTPTSAPDAPPLALTLGPRFHIGAYSATHSRLTTVLADLVVPGRPLIWAEVVLACERAAREMGCPVLAERQHADAEQHSVALVFSAPACGPPQPH